MKTTDAPKDKTIRVKLEKPKIRKRFAQPSKAQTDDTVYNRNVKYYEDTCDED